MILQYDLAEHSSSVQFRWFIPPFKQWKIYRPFLFVGDFTATLSDLDSGAKPCSPSGLTGKWMLHVQRHLPRKMKF